MTLPAPIASPPNFFTPRRCPAESRPLRDEPPAFLCAMVSFPLVRANCRDLHFGEGLAMAALSMRVLAPLLLESDDLFALALLEDLGLHRSAGDQRRARFGGLATQQQHI